jgi:hypothetical protein
LRGAWNLRGRCDTKIQVIEVSVSSLYIPTLWCYHDNNFRYFMFGKYNGFVSKARVSACMYFLVYWTISMQAAGVPNGTRGPLRGTLARFQYNNIVNYTKVYFVNHITVNKHTPIDISYNDVKCAKPIYTMSHRTMHVLGEPINFIKTLFSLRLVAHNCALGHHIECFSAFDVNIRKVYCFNF